MRDALRLAGLGGVVLFLFGLASYGFTGRFDLWTAVHLSAGGALIAAGALLNLARFRRTVASRGVRERAQAVTGALLFVAFLGAANVLAYRLPWTWDATAAKIHTLGAKTQAALDALDGPIEILAFFTTGDATRPAVEELLTRFAAASRGRLTWRFVDPERDPQVAEQLSVRRPSVLVARSDRATIQSAGDGAGGFSEGEVARLVLKAARSETPVAYIVGGHGEGSPDDANSPEGLGVLARSLAESNFAVRPLLLSTVADVPADATVLVIAGPRKPFLPHEMDVLRAYLGRDGRALLLLDPGSEAALEPVLADYRIVAGDDLIVDREEIPFLGARLGLDVIVDDFPEHSVTRGFRERILVSQARSMGVSETGGLPGVQVGVIARTGPSAWAEHSWREALRTGRVARDPDDGGGPVSVSVAVTTAGGGTRIVAVGDSDLARNAFAGRYFNAEFLTNAVLWLAGSEDLITEPPRRLRASRLEMTEGDFRTLFRFAVLLMPEVLLIFGLAVWWKRRSL